MPRLLALKMTAIRLMSVAGKFFAAGIILKDYFVEAAFVIFDLLNK